MYVLYEVEVVDGTAYYAAESVALPRVGETVHLIGLSAEVTDVHHYPTRPHIAYDASKAARAGHQPSLPTNRTISCRVELKSIDDDRSVADLCRNGWDSAEHGYVRIPKPRW